MQGDINSRLGGRIALVHAVDIGQNLLHLEGVVKLANHLGYAVQEGHDTLYRTQFLLQIGRHRGLAIAHNAVVFQLHLHIGSG